MDKSSLRIVFMGTPEFAVPCLRALVEGGYQVVGVITAPDRQAGRGLKLSQSAVKKYAVTQGLHILQPEKLKNPEFVEALRSLNAGLQVVVAFRMLPEIVWNMPPMGTLNLHASLLPDYRGAAPINWAIINGETATGLTTFRLQHTIDTGDILLQEKMPIGENETAGELHDRMMVQGAALLTKTVDGLISETLTEIPQDTVPGERLHHAPKLSTSTGELDFSKPVADVFNLVRGLSPYPGAYTQLNGKMLKVYHSEKEEGTAGAPGTITSDQKSFIKFACADGLLAVTDIQLEGKKRMPVADFLRGNRIVETSSNNLIE